MIVGITGTSGPFPRLVRALAEHGVARAEAVWIQHGGAELPPAIDGAPYVRREEMLERLGEADVVVTHAGCGSLFDAMSLGHTPVVVPRLARFGEHVNDHQLELLDVLSSEGRIIPVRDIADLGRAIDEARDRPATGVDRTRRAGLTAELMREIGDLAPASTLRRAVRTGVWGVLRLATTWLPSRRHP